MKSRGVYNEDDVVRVSEIGQYTFCARAWWLERVQGIPAENITEMVSGQASHQPHGRAVFRADQMRRLAFVLLSLAAAVTFFLVRVLSIYH
jgi:hypothetical protein